ncbi:MAG TPA: DUF2961 domain-containing protein, partial [Verrucomicrobiales bacterium]|nr:DUF2961 domain-containing protein [Verrucomicrobiales bacterium]
MKPALLSLLFATAAGMAHAGPELTYDDLARRLYDLKRLATPPATGEKTGSATSGDRASRYDAASDSYIDWYANNDGSGFVRREGDGIVAAELEGPGVIWRIWSAKPESGPVQFFIDGAPQPVLDVPFNRLFDAVKGPFPFKELVRDLAKGWNCFVPIPYQKSCRVVLGKGWGSYYQITSTKFPAGTTVPSFRGTLNDGEKAALTRAGHMWAQRNTPLPPAGGEVIEATLTLEPGQSVDVARMDSPRAIRGLICSVAETEATAMERTLRELTLSIHWDGEASPGVWAPLGDFFGSAPGFNPYRSLPCGMTRDGMYASWYMPFEKAIVRLSNDGLWPRAVTCKILL